MEISLSTLPAYARAFVESIPKQTPGGAYLVGLEGELGAGKTSFVQEVAKILGIEGRVTSPTFVVLKTYSIARAPFTHLVHADLYRLHKDDPDTIGWSEYMKDPKNLILAEWPERIHGGMPKGTRVISFSVIGDDRRRVEERTV